MCFPVIDRGSWEQLQQCFKDLMNEIRDLVQVVDLLRMKLVNGRHLQACLYMRCDFSAHDNKVKLHWEVEEEDKGRCVLWNNFT